MNARNLVFGLVACAATPALPQLSLLDPGFGQGGQVSPQLSASGPDRAGGLALLPDGRVLVAARRGGSSPALVAMRLQPDGSFDTDFSQNGIAPVQIGQYGEGRAIAALPDGSVLLAGNAYFDGTFNDLAVARFTPAGVLDVSFGSQGVAVFADPGAQDVVESLVPLADGRLQLGGRFDGARARMMAARLTAQGTLDASFGVGGIFRTADTTGESATTMLVRSSGEVVLGGSWQADLPTADLAVLQLTADGAEDPAFGTNGLFHPDQPGSTGDVVWMKEVEDGRLYIAGQRYLPGGTVLHHYIGRLTGTGDWDDTFGTNGRVTIAVSTPWLADLRDVVLRPDGRFVLAFNAINSVDASAALLVMRLLADGSPDPAFGEGGQVVMPCPGHGCGLEAIALQPDDKVVAVGYFVSGSAMRVLVQRWLPDAYQVGLDEEGAIGDALPYPVPCSDGLWLPGRVGGGLPPSIEWVDPMGRVRVVSGLLNGAHGSLWIPVPEDAANGLHFLRILSPHGITVHTVHVVR